MKKSALIIVFVFISVCSFAQTITIVDKSSLRPVSGANIKSDDRRIFLNSKVRIK